MIGICRSYIFYFYSICLSLIRSGGWRLRTSKLRPEQHSDDGNRSDSIHWLDLSIRIVALRVTLPLGPLGCEHSERQPLLILPSRTPIDRIVLLFPVRSHINTAATALAALHAHAEGWDLDLIGSLLTSMSVRCRHAWLTQ